MLGRRSVLAAVAALMVIAAGTASPAFTRPTSAGSTPVSPDAVLPLVVWTSWEGYRLPVPSNWTRQENWTSGGTTSDLHVDGVFNGTPASLIVDSTFTSGAREDYGYLEDFVNNTVAAVRVDYPNANLTSEDFRTLSGHAAVVAVIHFGTLLYEDLTVVSSQAHKRTWIVLLTAVQTQEAYLNATYEAILQGFQITAAPPGSIGLFGLDLLWIVALAAAIVGVVVLVSVVMILRRRTAPAKTSGEAKKPPEEPPPGEGG